MTEPHGRHREGVHLSNQLASMHGLLLVILQKVDTLERNSKPKRHIPKWLTPQMVFWIVIGALALGGHITLDQAKLLMGGMPK